MIPINASNYERFLSICDYFGINEKDATFINTNNQQNKPKESRDYRALIDDDWGNFGVFG